MHKSLDPTWIGALCWRAREFASDDLVLRKFRPAFGAWLLLLLALVVVVPTSASAQAPCTLLLQGSNPADPLTITAVVNCVAGTTTITIFWGDGTSTITSGGASITATHTYVPADCSIPRQTTPGICQIGVSTSTDCCVVSGYVDLTAPANPPPVFAGQSSVVQVSIGTETASANLQVTFECTTVTDASGGVHQALDLGITCNSNPPTITLTAGSQTVSIAIHTSGTALGSLAPAMRHKNVLYALLLPLSAFFLLGVRVGTLRLSRSATSKYVVTGMVILLIVFFSSCSGGFTSNPPVQSTPPGSYLVTVIDLLAPGQPPSAFVQTSLIVPLTVNQVQ
jgi:hypothetical protein